VIFRGTSRYWPYGNVTSDIGAGGTSNCLVLKAHMCPGDFALLRNLDLDSFSNDGDNEGYVRTRTIQ
jgi:hypothetical protein